MRKAAIVLGAACAALCLAMQPVQAAKTTLVIGLRLEPPHLDPTAGAAESIKDVTYANIFEGLTRIDETGAIRPDLAKSWEISADGLSYTFHLVPDAVFHDGEKLTSADVKFSLDRARGPDSVNAQKPLYTVIDRIDTPDPLTVVLHLAHPDGQLLFDLGLGDASIVTPKTAAGDRQHPIGTGPFMFKSWTPGDRIVLVRNPHYRDPKLPMLDTVTFRFIADPAAQVAALLAGDVDVFPLMEATESLPRFQNDPRFKVVIGSTEGKTILAMNNGVKPFNDIRVRKAVAYAIDRKAVIDGAMFGYGTPIGSHFSPNSPGYVDLTGLYPHDPAKAKALLAEAGYPNGFETTLKLPPPAYARRGGEIIAAELAEVGIKAKIVPVEWAEWLKTVFKGKNYDMTIVSHTEPMDIGIYARDDYYFNYHSDAFKAVIHQLNLTTDPQKRLQLLGKAQRIIADDCVNAFLFMLPKTMVERANLVGMWKNAPVQAMDVTHVYWK